MKMSLFPLVSVCLCVSFAPLAIAAPKLIAGTYEVDKAHSKVGFEVSHLVISSVEGRFLDFNATLKLADKIEQSSLIAKVVTVSIDTGNKDRDDHLRSPDFFDAKTFPELSFVSKEFRANGDGLDVLGTLTIKGVSRAGTFSGKVTGQGKDMKGRSVVAYKGRTTINRQDFGLKWSKVLEAGPVVGDSVDIMLSIEATKN